MSEIRTLKDGDVQVLPRTVSDAVSMKNGNSAEVEINNKADKELSNLLLPQQALINLGASPQINFIENDRFASAHIINQRGQTTYTNNVVGPCIDRWKLLGTMTININGINVQKTQAAPEFFVQILSDADLTALLGKTVTLSAVYNDGTRKINSTTFVVPEQGEIDGPEGVIGDVFFDLYKHPGDANARIRFFSSSATTSITLEAVELVIGNHQTIVYTDDDGKLQFLSYPIDESSLARCQRYGIFQGSSQLVATPLCIGYAFLSTPVPMRATPVIIGGAGVYGMNGNRDYTASVSVSQTLGNGVILKITGTTDLAYVAFSEGGGLSAEL